MKKIIAFTFVFACGNSTTPSDGGADAAPDVTDASDAAVEAGPVNDCTTFVDDTADGGTITMPADFNPLQFVPNCVHVKVGQSVTWAGDLTDHPIAAAGGDTPNPILSIGAGTSVTYAFPEAGTFGYHCAQHPTVMFGAVEVTP